MAPIKKGKVSAPPRRSADDMWVHDMHESALRSGSGRGAALATAAKPAFSGPPTNQLMVSNLHYEVTKKDLMAVFGQIGTLVREPDIRYDRSGRSTGTAVITFETSAEATRAKNQFQGSLAKNQPMAIEHYREPPKRRASEPSATGSTLLKRIEKTPLLERLTKAEAAVAKSAKVAKARGGAGRNRTKAPPSAPAAARPKRERKKPKTAEELDGELDAFMTVDKVAEPTSAPAAAPKDVNGDVEMA